MLNIELSESLHLFISLLLLLVFWNENEEKKESFRNALRIFNLIFFFFQSAERESLAFCVYFVSWKFISITFMFHSYFIQPSFPFKISLIFFEFDVNNSSHSRSLARFLLWFNEFHQNIEHRTLSSSIYIDEFITCVDNLCYELRQNSPYKELPKMYSTFPNLNFLFFFRRIHSMEIENLKFHCFLTVVFIYFSQVICISTNRIVNEHTTRLLFSVCMFFILDCILKIKIFALFCCSAEGETQSWRLGQSNTISHSTCCTLFSFALYWQILQLLVVS